jgi:hypothetical protein
MFLFGQFLEPSTSSRIFRMGTVAALVLIGGINLALGFRAYRDPEKYVPDAEP